MFVRKKDLISESIGSDNVSKYFLLADTAKELYNIVLNIL